MKARNNENGKLKENRIDFILSIFSLLSFIPLISLTSIIFFSVNLLFIKRRVKETLFFFNIAIITSLIYFGYLKPKGEELDKEIFFAGFHPKREKLAIERVNYYNKRIIEYKSKNGFLPSKLEDIQNGFMDFEDRSFVESFEKHKTMKFAKYNYEKVDSNHYHLYGLGPDGLPKTDDDLLPEIIISDTLNTELVRYTVLDKSNGLKIK